MAVRYFDSVLGNDSNDGLTPATAWASVDNKMGSCVGGDTILFARGTTQIINGLYRQFPNGSISAPTYVGAYGTGALPVFKNPTSNGSMIFNASNSSYVIYEDLDFDASYTSGAGNNQCIYLSAQGVGASNNITFRRCIFRNSLGNGSYIGQETTASNAPYSILLEDCVSFSNGAHGYLCHGYNVVYNRCVAYNNGLSTGAHGFSAYRLRDNVTSGWTLVSGNVYSQTMTRSNYYYVRINSGAQASVYPQLFKNTTTPTTPGAGEWGFAGGVMYINIGANPSGHTLTCAYGGGGYNIKYNNCVAFGNHAYPIYPYHEGHGIALDDFTSFSEINNCWSINNEGAGVSINQGENNIVRNCVLANNDYPGIALAGYPTHYINNNLLYNNNRTTPYTTGEILLTGRTSSLDIKNNVIYSTYAKYGILSSSLDKTGTVISNNLIYSPLAEQHKWRGTSSTATYSNNILPYALFEGTNGASQRPTGWGQSGAQSATTTLTGPEVVAGVSTKVVQFRRIAASGTLEGMQVTMSLSANKTYTAALYVRIPSAVTASDIIFYYPGLLPNQNTFISSANLAALPKDVWIRLCYTFSTTTGSQTIFAIGSQSAGIGEGFDLALPQLNEVPVYNFVEGTWETNTYVVNPALRSDLTISNASAVKGKGLVLSLNGKDINGVQREVPPSLGPWEARGR